MYLIPSYKERSVEMNGTTMIKQLIEDAYGDFVPTNQGYYDVLPSKLQGTLDRVKQLIERRIHGLGGCSDRLDDDSGFPTMDEIFDEITQVGMSLEFKLVYYVMGQEILNLCFPGLLSRYRASEYEDACEEIAADDGSACSGFKEWRDRFESEFDSEKRTEYLESLEPMELLVAYGRQLISLHKCQISVLHPEGLETPKDEKQRAGMLGEIADAFATNAFPEYGPFAEMRCATEFLDEWYEPLKARMEQELQLWKEGDYREIVRLGLWYGTIPFTDDWKPDWDAYYAEELAGCETV